MKVTTVDFKGIKLWHVAITVIVILIAVFFIIRVSSCVNQITQRQGPSEEKLTTVTNGTFVKEIPITGRLHFPNHATLEFGVSGTVGDVMITVGETVVKGQPLARLESKKLASLQAAVATRNLEKLKAHAKLSIASQPTSSTIAKAESNLLAAKLTLDSAEASLEELLDLDSEYASNSYLAVADAKANVDAAQETFEDIREGFPTQSIDESRNKLDFAKTNYENAIRNLEVLEIKWRTILQSSEENYDDSLEAYSDAYSRWIGIGLDQTELSYEPSQILSNWEIDLDQVFSRTNPDYVLRTTPVEDPSTPWDDLVVWGWLNLYPDAVLITGSCGNDTPIQQICVLREFENAWDAYSISKDDLDTNRDQSISILKTASDTVTLAGEALDDAQEQLNDMVAGPNLYEVERAEASLSLALASLENAQETLGKVGDDAESLESLHLIAQVAVAKASVEEAKIQLTAATDSYPFTNTLRQAELVITEKALEEAVKEFEGGIIQAPFDGVVTLVNVIIDDEVTSDSRVIEIIDPSIVEIKGFVDAAEIDLVEEGATAVITMKSLSGLPITGTVSSVDTKASTERGVISYGITLRAVAPEGMEVPTGLSGVSGSVTYTESGVLILPRIALITGLRDPKVRVLTGEIISERPVILGNVNDQWAVVLSGLAPGEQVAVPVFGPPSDDS